MKRIIRQSFAACIFASLWASQAASAPTSATDPSQIVASLYAKLLVSGHPAPLVNASERRALLSTGLFELWAKADAIASKHKDDIGPVDFDVTTNSQGMDIKSYSLRSEPQDSKHTIVVAKLVPDNWLRSSPRENELRYYFVFERNRWAIYDIRGVAEPHEWSLREILLRSLHSPTGADQ